VVANFEQGSINRWTTMATTNSFAATLRRENALQFELADHFQDGGHVAMGKSLAVVKVGGTSG